MKKWALAHHVRTQDATRAQMSKCDKIEKVHNKEWHGPHTKCKYELQNTGFYTF